VKRAQPLIGGLGVRDTLGWMVLALLVIVATVLVSAPAGLGDVLLARLTDGRVRLAQAQGSIWSGEARVVVVQSTPGASQAEGRSQRPPLEVLQGLAVPGVLHWQIRPLALLAGVLDASLQWQGMAEPVRLEGSATRVSLSAGAMELPALALANLGSPWNTIRPTATLALQWQALRISREGLNGNIAVELRDVSSAMAAVSPLGSYHVEVQAEGPQATLTLSTVTGALKLSGKGRWSAASGLQFSAQARAADSERERLDSLLNLIGRREGDHVVIRIGA
jgi:general secretion pathway protein N